MKKAFGLIAVGLLMVSMLSSCGSRRGDKCPGIGSVEMDMNYQTQSAS